MRQTAVYLEAIGIQAPGVNGWDAFKTLIPERKWILPSGWTVTPNCLSPRQSKRLSETTRLALACAEQISDHISSDAGWVFASSLGEGLTLDVILNALSAEDILISPMKFQNAVHNAAVGQWTIAKSLQGPSTSIAAFDETAGAGMLKALMQCIVEQIPIGLVVYDWPLPDPLHAKRPMSAPCAIALAFSPVPTAKTLCRMVCSSGRNPRSSCTSAVGIALENTGNPAAALLPLLELIASERSGIVSIALSGGSSIEIGLAEQ